MSEDEFWPMLPREFTRLVEAYNNRREEENDSAWARTLLLTNHVREFMGGDSITLEDLKEGNAEPPSREEFLEAKRKREERRKG